MLSWTVSSGDLVTDYTVEYLDMWGISSATCSSPAWDSSTATSFVSGVEMYTLNDYHNDQLDNKPCGYYFYLDYGTTGT